MSERCFKYRSADGKTNIAAKCWYSENAKPWAVLQIVHGMVEHKERYGRFAAYLADKGIIVYAHDHLGHGDSVISDSEYGYMSDSSQSDIMIADMHHLHGLIKKENPGIPCLILGHSMGSYLLRKYLVVHPDDIDGAVIMGTGQNPEALLHIAVPFLKIMACLFGWHYRNKNLQKLVYNKHYKKFDLTEKNYTGSWLTKDTEIVKAYREDPKCGFTFTLSGYMALLETVLFDVNEKNIGAIDKNLKMLVVSGSEDPVGDCGGGVKKFFAILKKTGHENARMKLYEGDRHEILNELDRQEVYDDIYSWISSFRLL